MRVTYNQQGEVEGVKYDRLSVAFVNAFKEQQAQIEAQQRQIKERERMAASQQQQIEQYRNQLATQQARISEQGAKLAQQEREIGALKQLLCPAHPQAEVCKETKRKP